MEQEFKKGKADRAKRSAKKNGRRWLLRLILAILGVLLVIPALFYILMTVVSALSKPANPEAAKRQGDKLLRVKNKTVITVSAHPDDVDYWASGALAKLHQNGNSIIMILGTSGEKGNKKSNLDKIREEEQEKAGRIVGYDEIIFLRHPDRGLKADAKFKNELRKIFRQFQPDILFTFDIEKESLIYHHSDHRAAGIAAHSVAPEFDSIKTIYQFHTKAPNVIVDVTDIVDVKARALNAHHSVRGQGNGILTVLATVFQWLGFSDDNNYRRYGLENSFRKSLGVKYAEIFRVIDNDAR